jgi:putative salt-induced outer membrane protein YdiY/ketosteroid isomerase-like protein
MLVAAALLGPAGAAAQVLLPDNQEAEVRAAEEALNDGLAVKNADAVRALIASGFRFVSQSPADAGAWIDVITSLCGSGRISTRDLRVLSGGDTAVVTYTGVVNRVDPCDPASIPIRVTDVWTRADGTWRLVLRNETVDAQPVAAPVAPSRPPEWAGTAELTILSTRGNVNTFTFGSSGEVAWQRGPWRTNMRAAFVRTTDSGLERGRSINLEVRQSRAMSPVAELFGRAHYQRDLFSGILRRIGADAGVGLVFVRDGQRLQLTIGAGSTTERRINSPADVIAPTAAAGVHYRWTLSAATSIAEEALVTTSLARRNNWRAESTLSLTTTLRRPLALRTSYQTRYLNEPVPGFKRLDAVLSMSVVARF